MYVARRVALPGESELEFDWPLTVRLAKQGASEGIRAWFAETEVRGGAVDGETGHLTPGSLVSRGFFRQSMWTAMIQGGASELLAPGFADATWESWKAWFDGYEIELEYPALAAVESASAAPVANKPMLFSKGKSLAHDRLEVPRLQATLELALIPFAMIPGTREACHELSCWLSGCFERWRATAMLMSVMASGPVPSYAPPEVTRGPVAGGTLFARRPVLTDLGFFDPLRE